MDVARVYIKRSSIAVRVGEQILYVIKVNVCVNCCCGCLVDAVCCMGLGVIGVFCLHFVHQSIWTWSSE